jgi:hypothetical protein
VRLEGLGQLKKKKFTGSEFDLSHFISLLTKLGGIQSQKHKDTQTDGEVIP